MVDNRNNEHDFDGWEWVGAVEAQNLPYLRSSSSRSKGLGSKSGSRTTSVSSAYSGKAYPTSERTKVSESGMGTSSDTSSDSGGPMSDDEPPPGLDSVQRIWWQHRHYRRAYRCKTGKSVRKFRRRIRRQAFRKHRKHFKQVIGITSDQNLEREDADTFTFQTG